MGTGEYLCPHTSDRYVLLDDRVTRVSGPKS
jgi:hypothetical protein